ncbi:membrane-bound alkaline phosphatase-like [Episyrphus balteatus]|uniref:membrane-bound alkaline phosphatase-like n=1 Tax=Episyrphus balteatus TaxID=286459 RepID=UPI0024863611|nr:membrane-bound alkaline phosphatase-like [Episyrphus balteatus]
MRSINSGLLLALSFCILSISALPQRCQENEDCYETRLHPDLTDTPDINSRKLEGEDKTNFWIESGKSFVLEQQAKKINTNVAKNVILFLGDGMGLTTIAAARVSAGGEEQKLSFEKFPYTGLSKTYSVDRIVPDSANTATAYLCGIKANYGTIGVNANVDRENCEAGKKTENYVYSAAKWALDAEKAAGFVTTTRVTHASPSGVYAHTADREWENDSEVKKSCGAASGVQDIAYQLIHGDVGSKLKVMLGGGRMHFTDASLGKGGKRSDGRNLIEEYTSQGSRNVYVETRDQLLKVSTRTTDRLLGMFQDSHLKYNLEVTPETNQPTLEEMTKKAIELLQKEKNGYFLFVEGGKIDLAHHENQPQLALDEALQFSKTIEMARSMTSEEDTLIVVTADHSHAFSYSGYAKRGASIFGPTKDKADDGKPLLTLSYANGPGFKTYYDTEKNDRIDPTSVDKTDPHVAYPTTVELDLETHGGDDVAVYASGPWSHLFTGVYEQNTIPHLYAYAACMGNGLKAC